MASASTSTPVSPRSIIGGEDAASLDAVRLAVACSHFDLGVIRTMVEVNIGSRRSRKWLIRSEAGDFVLKERAPASVSIQQVAFGHALQLRLEASSYPVASLVGTRTDRRSFVEVEGRVYDLTRLIRAGSYDRTEGQARGAGRALVAFQATLAGTPPQEGAEPQGVLYHRRGDLDTVARQLPPWQAAVREEGAHAVEVDVPKAMRALLERYRRAGEEADSAGYHLWPRTLVHGDWHPGNLLFREDHVAGVFDFDTARFEPRVIDIANGLLQFAIETGGSGDPSTWPDGFNESLCNAFLAGYDSFDSRFVLSVAEAKALPWLMIEALVAETVPVVAQTGRFGRWGGHAFLQVVDRKVRWLADHAPRLSQGWAA